MSYSNNNNTLVPICSKQVSIWLTVTEIYSQCVHLIFVETTQLKIKSEMFMKESSLSRQSLELYFLSGSRLASTVRCCN